MGVPKVSSGRGGVQALRHRESYNMTQPLKSPFSYPGGKADIATAVWARLGDTPNYVEPFCGSAAVVLGRPHDLDGKTETLNDADAFVTNALRAIEADREATAYWCDRPVNEIDLTASHLWLKAQRAELTARCFADVHYYDAEIAGRWLWGIASWIGDGWCVADGPWIAVDGKLVDRRTIGSNEAGVTKKMPEMDHDRGARAYRNAPGVPKKMPKIDTGDGEGTTLCGVLSTRSTAPAALLAYFERLATRLRRVRILCGDWRRVVKPSITVNHGLTSVFMDPPYPQAEHGTSYHGDNNIWHDAAQWAIENGDSPLLRIAVCGYFSEQTDALFPPTWERYKWEARGGYSNQSPNGRGRANAKRECVWFSPNCINAAEDYGPLFEEPR
jgi:DNA adenine methylase